MFVAFVFERPPHVEIFELCCCVHCSETYANKNFDKITTVVKSTKLQEQWTLQV